MSEASLRNSPLYRVLEPAVSGLSERAFETQIVLRGDAADAAFPAAVKNATGLDLPLLPNTVNAAGERRIAWLGPFEWQLTAPGADEAALVAALEAALAGQHAAVVNVSDAQTVILVAGADAVETLCRDCPLDFHPRAFPVGSCAQSVVGKAGALIVREAEDRFALCVRRSFAEYLWAQLRHSIDMVRRAR